VPTKDRQESLLSRMSWVFLQGIDLTNIEPRSSMVRPQSQNARDTVRTIIDTISSNPKTGAGPTRGDRTDSAVNFKELVSCCAWRVFQPMLRQTRLSRGMASLGTTRYEVGD
jgi:hypothetical protein